eukprot:GCRY01002395.1.p1 GENE.GCRY01002395.1~~GCRY01002395.1.p1  ORF type:complete len:229 (+),score=40.09 GCRY01002395.1:173-859(+)
MSGKKDPSFAVKKELTEKAEAFVYEMARLLSLSIGDSLQPSIHRAARSFIPVENAVADLDNTRNRLKTAVKSLNNEFKQMKDHLENLETASGQVSETLALVDTFCTGAPASPAVSSSPAAFSPPQPFSSPSPQMTKSESGADFLKRMEEKYGVALSPSSSQLELENEKQSHNEEETEEVIDQIEEKSEVQSANPEAAKKEEEMMGCSKATDEAPQEKEEVSEYQPEDC